MLLALEQEHERRRRRGHASILRPSLYRRKRLAGTNLLLGGVTTPDWHATCDAIRPSTRRSRTFTIENTEDDRAPRRSVFSLCSPHFSSQTRDPMEQLMPPAAAAAAAGNPLAHFPAAAGLVVNQRHRSPAQTARLLGALVRRQRVHLHLSQSDLAMSIGVSKSYLSRFEHGDFARPAYQLMRALALALGWRSIDDMLAELEHQTGATGGGPASFTREPVVVLAQAWAEIPRAMRGEAIVRILDLLRSMAQGPMVATGATGAIGPAIGTIIGSLLDSAI